MSSASELDRIAQRFLRRALSPADSIKAEAIALAEQSLGLSLPEVLRTYYSKAGACEELSSVHNEVVEPARLEIAGEHLIFMHENQRVVSWGFRIVELGESNPTVWQRNNTDMKWYSEEQAMLPFLESMFDWYEESGVWT